jgi:hypothetical protein
VDRIGYQVGLVDVDAVSGIGRPDHDRLRAHRRKVGLERRPEGLDLVGRPGGIAGKWPIMAEDDQLDWRQWGRGKDSRVAPAELLVGDWLAVRDRLPGGALVRRQQRLQLGVPTRGDAVHEHNAGDLGRIRPGEQLRVEAAE